MKGIFTFTNNNDNTICRNVKLNRFNKRERKFRSLLLLSGVLLSCWLIIVILAYYFRYMPPVNVSKSHQEIEKYLFATQIHSSIDLASASKLPKKLNQSIETSKRQTETLRTIRMHNIYRTLSNPRVNDSQDLYPVQYKTAAPILAPLAEYTLIQQWETTFSSSTK